MRLILDTEFTGLHQQARLISLALCAQDGAEFYAEFLDYAAAGCDPWVIEHVIPRTRWLSRPGASPGATTEGQVRLCFGDSAQVTAELRPWLAQWDAIEVWGDCLAYDWVLFCELFGGARSIPGHIGYIPLDLATLFKLKGLDPDTDRASFAGISGADQGRHNALWDARVQVACLALLQHMTDHPGSG
jgi:hypothetical protein